MIPAAAASAMAVAAFGLSDSNTRENVNRTRTIAASAPIGDQDRQEEALPFAAIAHRPIPARISRSTLRNFKASQPSVVSSCPHRKKTAAITTHRIAPPMSFITRPATS